MKQQTWQEAFDEIAQISHPQWWEKDGARLYFQVDVSGRVTVTAELLAQILQELGFKKVDPNA